MNLKIPDNIFIKNKYILFFILVFLFIVSLAFNQRPSLINTTLLDLNNLRAGNIPIFNNFSESLNQNNLQQIRQNALGSAGLDPQLYSLSTIPFEQFSKECQDRNVGTDMQSEESFNRLILANPLMLLMPRLNNMPGAANPNTSDSKQTEIVDLTYTPGQRTVEMTVQFKKNPFSHSTSPTLDFKLIAINAWDLGYNSFRLSQIESDFQNQDIDHSIYPTVTAFGCAAPESQNTFLITPSLLFKISHLPSRVSFDLWKESVDNQAPQTSEPDMKFIVVFADAY